MSGRSIQIVVITGMSGSGKTTANRALEDAGYFCIDNLPIVLLPKLTKMAAWGEEGQKLALVVDAREGTMLKDAKRVFEEVRRAGHQISILFLESSDESLIRRFSETRRRHPLAPQGTHLTVAEGLHAERMALSDLREMADQVIDTTELTVHDLKRRIQSQFMSDQLQGPSISVTSFGFRHGIPPHADLVLDVRFLPNPHFVPELRGLTGGDAQVADYVLKREDAQVFLTKALDLCRFLFPRYQKEGKSYLTVAIGCTGGRHRSVAIAHELTERLRGDGARVQLWDRDADKD